MRLPFTRHQLAWLAGKRCPGCGSYLVHNPNTGQMTSCMRGCHLDDNWPADAIVAVQEGRSTDGT